MQFLFFSKGDKTVPSSRYRAYYPADALNNLGHKATVVPTERRGVRAFWYYLQTLLVARDNTHIILQRTIYHKFFFLAVLIAYLFGKRFVFDIDDAIYEHSPRNSSVLARLARVVTCGSEYIMEWAETQNKSCHILLNGLPLDVYTVRSSESDEYTIGWIGSGPAHYKNLQMLPPIFEKLHERGLSFRFRLIGALQDERIYALFQDVPYAVDIVDTLDWDDPHQAVREIHTFTFGVMPLTDTKWNHAKYFKALEYMACGVPVVASATNTLAHISSKSGCGHLADTREEWVDAFEKLSIHASLRTKEAKCGRSYIERRHSSHVMAKELLSVIG